MRADPPPDPRAMTMGGALDAARRCEKLWRSKARAAQRTPATKPSRRDRLSLTAVDALRQAIFWRVILVEHQASPPGARVGDLVGSRERTALWTEAAYRVRELARAGALKPGAEADAVAAGLALAPGGGGDPAAA